MSVEQILDNIYKIEVPLPRNPLRSINDYLIKDKTKSILIDTAMNMEECSEVLIEALNSLNIDFQNLDLIITHMHADHAGLLGLIKELSKNKANIYMSELDGNILNDISTWDKMHKILMKNGFPEELLEKAILKHPGHMFSHKSKFSFIPLNEGDSISINKYNLTFVSTPGHTQGHICIYEKNNNILFSGDHILDDITPIIAIETSEDINPLDNYMKSLEKISNYNINLVLPGHRKIITDINKRIDEIIKHHYKRLNEIVNILKNNKVAMSAYEMASQMSWDINYSEWGDFPIAQKWFATGEAASHLEYLYQKGEIKKKYNNNKIYYYI
ncbi:MAG: MBL fold metallo-hydrolase [Deferribacterota bacterium]|nr:MBL fold metallo-hydrolase [Deferribacterota bacterium]